MRTRDPIHIKFLKSYYKEQRMAVVADYDHINHGRTTLIGMARPVDVIMAAASWMTEVNGQPSQQRHLPEYPNDACASRELAKLLMQ